MHPPLSESGYGPAMNVNLLAACIRLTIHLPKQVVPQQISKNGSINVKNHTSTTTNSLTVAVARKLSRSVKSPPMIGPTNSLINNKKLIVTLNFWIVLLVHYA